MHDVGIMKMSTFSRAVVARSTWMSCAALAIEGKASGPHVPWLKWCMLKESSYSIHEIFCMHPDECQDNNMAFLTSVLHSNGSVELEDSERLTCGTRYPVRKTPSNRNKYMQKPPNTACLGNTVANRREKFVGRQKQVAASIRRPQKVAKLKVHSRLLAS